jgi:hypothetical protein
MKNGNYKIIKIGLVIFLIIAGFGSVLANPDDSKTPELILNIDSPQDGASFLEPMPLQKAYINIRVVDQNDYPVYDVVVHVFEMGQDQIFIWRGFTDVNGIAYWPQPTVDHDTIYKIRAEKLVNGDYKECFIYVTIRNRYVKLFVSANTVDEGKEFFSIIKDQDDQPVFMATVKFNGETKFTNSYGITSTFQAPWVDADTTFVIEAFAQLRGYDDNRSTLTVNNFGDPTSYKIYGQVRDYNFQPLENVKITIIKGSYSYNIYTNNKGDYILWIIPKEGGEWITIKASFSGYTIQSETRWINGFDTNPLHINFWFEQENNNGYQNT